MTASIFLALSFASAFPATTTLAQHAATLEDHGYGSLAVGASLLLLHGVPGFDCFAKQRKASPESRLVKIICAFVVWISPCLWVGKIASPD